MRPITLAAVAALAAGPLLADHHAPKGGEKDIVQTAVEAGKFSTLAKALEAAGLVEALKGEGPFTVFAPTDDAFAALPDGTLDALLEPENKDKLVAVLQYHVVPGRFPAAEVGKADRKATLNGQRLDVAVDDHGVTVDGASVVQADVTASNGVIHVVDRVLLPNTHDLVATAEAAGSFSTLLRAAQAAGLAETLAGEGPFTIFAPTDEAFAALPSGTLESLLRPENKDKLARILKYHVVPKRVYADQALTAGSAKTLADATVMVGLSDGRLTVGDATVLANDLQAANGVIHVIDAVLMPPSRGTR